MNALLSEQAAQNRLDLIVRVFQLKLQALLTLFTEKDVFGRIVTHVYIIEFQKRDLSHAHIFIILQVSDKPHNSTDYDRMICAELSNKTQFSELHEIIISCMLHELCELANFKAPCMKNDKCSKHYLKPVFFPNIGPLNVT